jgi:succinate dehydrogenase hydrophobic anchor subunit
VVIEDYVHAAGLKVVSLVLSRFAHIFVAVVSIYAILRIGLGA